MEKSRELSGRVPAGQEKNDSTSSGAAGAHRLPAAEAAAGHHYDDLAQHQEQKCADSVSGCYVGVIHTIIVLDFAVLLNRGLKKVFPTSSMSILKCFKVKASKKGRSFRYRLTDESTISSKPDQISG